LPWTSLAMLVACFNSACKLKAPLSESAGILDLKDDCLGEHAGVCHRTTYIKHVQMGSLEHYCSLTVSHSDV
jgi:hypothetical protein